MNKLKLAAMGLAGSLLAAPMGSSLAAVAPGVYAGGGVGYFRVDEQNFRGTDGDLNDEQAAYKIFAGWNPLPWLGVEGGWVSFGEAGDDPHFESDGWTLAAVAYLPLNRWAPYVKLGQYFWDSEASFDDEDLNDDGNDTFGGAGVLFQLTEVVDLRIEYERYQVNDSDIDMGSVNAQVRF